MSRLSENRISHLAHLIINGLKGQGIVEFAHEGRALLETKQALRDFFQKEDDIDGLVRQKLLSLSRRVPPGSREWDVLYRKYYEEELRKRRR